MQHTRDVIVIGCSAGGVEMLPRLLQPLPENIPASITIVQHLAPTPTPYLADILRRVTPMPVAWVEQGVQLEHGHVYIAPADSHVLFTDSHLSLSRTARENHVRPSIDKLFRSAAAQHGAGVIGVLLTGMLDDGVAGLRAIHDAGGIAIVQDPDEAPFPELPNRALLALAPDRVLPVLGIATTLIALTGEPIESWDVPAPVAAEAELDTAHGGGAETLRHLGPQSTVSCPDCHGPTWELGDPYERRYRCYLGHVNTAREMLARQAIEVESALWDAVRALSDRATMLETLAADATRLGRAQVAELYTTRGRQTRSQADLARRFVMDLTG